MGRVSRSASSLIGLSPAVGRLNYLWMRSATQPASKEEPRLAKAQRYNECWWEAQVASNSARCAKRLGDLTWRVKES